MTMQAQRVTHRALDGTAVTLSGELDLSSDYTSHIRIDFTGVLHELSSGDAKFGRDWTRLIGIGRMAEEFQAQGGRLRIGTATMTDRSLRGIPALCSVTEKLPLVAAVWEGQDHAVCAHFYHAARKDAVQFFDALRIREHSDGISLTPKVERHATVAETASITKLIPGVGLLEISRLNRETARGLPKWRGTRLRGGELFRGTQSDGSIYFMFVTQSAVATVVPDKREVRYAPARLNALTVHADS